MRCKKERIVLDATLVGMVKAGVFLAVLNNGHSVFVWMFPSDKRVSHVEWTGRYVKIGMTPCDMDNGEIISNSLV